MPPKEKDLLFQDLCSRLPYKNLKVRGVFFNYNKDINRCQYEECDREFKYEDLKRYETLKPYLFPLSSMTEEQKCEYQELCETIPIYDNYYGIETLCGYEYKDTLYSIDWLIQNNFDYRGLIPLDLAIDATGLNIY